MQYRRGLILVTAISFAIWVAASASISCFTASVVEGYEFAPDSRLGGCDSIFTSALRALTGDTYRKPFYDIIYDPNFSFLWLFGTVFAVWFMARKLRPQRQIVNSTDNSSAATRL